MAKTGLSYYQAETDRFQDIKVKRLKKRYGCEGYAVYQYIQTRYTGLKAVISVSRTTSFLMFPNTGALKSNG